MDTAKVSDVVPTDRWEITDRSGIMVTGTRAAKIQRLRQPSRGRLAVRYAVGPEPGELEHAKIRFVV